MYMYTVVKFEFLPLKRLLEILIMQCSAALPVVLGGAHAMRGLAQAKNAGNYF